MSSTVAGHMRGSVHVYEGGTRGWPAGKTLRHPGSLPGQVAESLEEYATITLGRDGVITTWNGVAAQLFGYQESEIRSLHFVKLLPPEAAYSDVPARLLAVAGQLRLISEEHWCLRRDGTRFWATLSVSPLFDGHGALQGFALAIRNQTKRRQIRRAQQFLADTSYLLYEAPSEEVLLDLLANLPVPLLADYCTVHRWSGGPELQLAATSELGGNQETAIWQDLWSTSGALDYVRHLERALSTGAPVLAPATRRASPAQGHTPLGHGRGTGLLHPRSIMVVPIKVRGTVVGALSLVALQPERTFGVVDLTQASQFVQLGALALERLLVEQEIITL